ncbi:hypothetical protein [Lebetimonas sp. JH292]|uniref:hypothetical protein n=1 Tax=Lebetimonas sp. JH292 TaxID=990068 RepID=UPI000465A234|nr:hypothetical protein [Lebetimonas sp. JH292]
MKRLSDLDDENTPIEEIAKKFSEYSPEQLEGFTNESHPDSDIIFTNTDTGEKIALSLKATHNPEIIEHALLNYPDTPILTTKEISDYFEHNPEYAHKVFGKNCKRKFK